MKRVLLLIRRRIAIKLTLTLVGFAAVTSLAAGLYLDMALGRYAVESVEERLLTLGRMLHEDARALIAAGAGAAPTHDFTLRASRPTGARVTLVAPDGRVLGESDRSLEDLARLENHGNRPEVRTALAGRIGRDLRRSATVATSLLYVALPVTEGARTVGALRLAVSLSAVAEAQAGMRRVMLAGGLVVLAVALAVGILVAGRLTRPVVEMQSVARQMSEGNFSLRMAARSPDEIGALARSLNVMATRLREKIQDLAQERTRLTAILDAMVEGVIAVDGHEHIVLINERARALLALGRRRANGVLFLDVIRHPDLHALLQDARRATAGSVVPRELRLPLPTARLLEVHAVPLPLDAQETGVVMVVHDVTDLRRLERVRTEFMANVSHELRTPLTAIHGYLETVLGGALEDREETRRFLEVVFRHTERLGRLLDDLTDLSNIELGRVALRMASVGLEEVVESVLAIIRPGAEAKGVTVEHLPLGAVPPVRADYDRLAQIFINLVDNAVKYTPAGGRVTVSAQPDAAGMVEASVTDTGVGIPPSDLPRVTERFYRVDKARSRELGGTGLGLAIVKHLVMAHGGELHIESQPGNGTCVRFTIPRAEVVVEA